MPEQMPDVPPPETWTADDIHECSPEEVYSAE